MSDLDRQARRLVGGWPSGGLVVGLLPDSGARSWSGKAALELAAAAAHDRLASLVLDLAPDASDLAGRFGADPEPGFAQVMTGEVELSQIQHWDAGRGAYYLPGGVRVLSDKVAKSRSVEALAERVRSQEGILFVLLDRHAAEAAAEAGWLDGVVRLGDANLGGPKMFNDVDTLGRLERREPVEKPWERGSEETPEPAAGSAPAGTASDTAASDGPDEADLTVEPDEPAATEPESPGATPEPREPAGPPDTPDTGEPAETDRPLEPAASAEPDVDTGPETPGEPEVPDEPGQAEVTGPRTTIEVSEDAWEHRATAGTEVLDRPGEVGSEADEDAETPEPGVVDASDGDEAAEEPPVLEVPEDLWEAAEARGEVGVTEEPEIAAGEDELADGDEAPAAPETDEQEDRDEPELEEAAEVETEPAPAGPDLADAPEVAGSPEQAAEAETADDAEVETDTDGQTVEPEVDTEAEPARPEISGEPELTEAARESEAEVGADRETSDAAEAEEPDELSEPEVEEPAEEEIDRPAGLERFAEIADSSAGEETSPDVEEDREDEESDEPGVEAAEEAAGDDAEPAAEETEEAGDELPEPREPVHADVITSGLEVWPEEQPVTAAEPEGAAPDADDDGQEPQPAGASVISAALWARPEENGGPEEAEAPVAEDFITPAMWVAGATGEEQATDASVEEGSAAVISGGQWAPAAGAGEAAEVESPEHLDLDGAGEPEEPAAAEEAADAGASGDTEDSGEPQRADFILDGLELPPEWSQEWEEEEREAAGAADVQDAAEEAPSGEAEEGGKADFVTQGMGIPDDDDEQDDPWPDSGTSTDWSRDSGSSSGTWERDPYGSSTGRAAAATVSRPERRGLALSRRGQEGGELWRKARTAAIVVLTVGSLGVFGSAVIESGALGSIGDVVATAVSGPGGGEAVGDGGSGDGGSGDVAAAGAGGGGVAAAAADSARSTSTDRPDGRPGSGAAPPAGGSPGGATPPLVSDSPRFHAVSDSLRRSIEEYGDQMDLYREGEIGCPLLMSAREEANRLFMRLSMFRYSEGARPDSDFQAAYRQFSENMESVEQSYRQTECPRPSTAAPAESTPGGPPVPEPAAADSAEGDSVAPQLEEAPSDSAGAGGDTASTDTLADALPAGRVTDTTASRPASDTSSAAAPSADSATGGQPADTSSSGG